MPQATLDDVPLKDAVNYACRDADGTYRLFPILSQRIDDMGLRGCYQMDLAIVPMVERMISHGILIDKQHFSMLNDYLSDLMSIKQKEIIHATHAPADFNPNSPPQTRELLFHRMGLKTGKRTSTGLDSTNDKVLESLRFKDPRVGLICDYRELSKLRDSFCVTLPLAADATGRIHPNLQLTRVSSGRLSCKEPNLLAIPVRTDLAKLVREGFVAGPGYVLGDWDLDQIEMREMAHQSQDPVMIKWFMDGLDVHRMTGAAAFGCKPEDVTSIQRYASKRLGFGIITGITEKGLAEQMALAGAEGWDEQTCYKFIQEYFIILKGVKGFLDDCRAEARRFGYVRDRWGRIRYLPGVHSELSWVREEALRQSHSFKISASAQGILKHSMAAIWEWMKDDDRIQPLLQVHDELLFEIRDDKETIDEVNDAITYFLCNTTKLCVPIKSKGSTGPSWGVLKD